MDKEQLRRQKISQTLKGRMPKNLAFIHALKRTDEWKRKIGVASKGRKHSEVTKRKCGLANKGRKLTKEHREKLSANSPRYWLGKKREDMVGVKNWNYGKYGSQHSRYVESKKTSLRKAVRQSKKYRDYKCEILRINNFQCAMCKKGSVYLELDHYPLGFAELFEKNNITTIEKALSCGDLWDLKNGRVLCQSCHEKTDNFPKQLINKRKRILYRERQRLLK